jgi:hypothetical protein
MNKESCAALLEEKRYDFEILPQLEAYVEDQCKSQSYDLDANLAVLKLYKFHPDKSNEGIVAKVLLKALMNLPHTDYLLCTYLIPESLVSFPPLLRAQQAVGALHHLIIFTAMVPPPRSKSWRPSPPSRRSPPCSRLAASGKCGQR